MTNKKATQTGCISEKQPGKVAQEDVDKVREERQRLIDLARTDLERFKSAFDAVVFAAKCLEYAQSKVEPGATTSDPDQVKSGSDNAHNIEDKIHDLIEKKAALNREIDARQDLKNEIMERIDKIEDKIYQQILIAKYLHMMPLSKIPIFYSEVQKKRMHHDALYQYSTMIPDDTL